MGFKGVESVDEHSQGGKDYVEVRTADGWYYVFRRLLPGEPYRIHDKRRPDGSTPEKIGARTPVQVKEYMDKHYDVAQMHAPTYNNFDQEYWP